MTFYTHKTKREKEKLFAKCFTKNKINSELLDLA